jgi:hypothetical protein
LDILLLRKDINGGANKLESVKGELKDAKQERDKYQVMLAPFEAAALKLYTNVPASEGLQQLSDQILSAQSNLLISLESQRPSFDLYNDTRLITNGSIISLKENRTLELHVYNATPCNSRTINRNFLYAGRYFSYKCNHWRVLETVGCRSN